MVMPYRDTGFLLGASTLAAALAVSLAGCSDGGGSAPEREGENTAQVDTPDGYERVETGPVTYAMPEDWEQDEAVIEGWTRYLGAHESEPDLAAAEIADYQDIPSDATPQEAATFIQEEFPSANDGDISVQDAGPADIPGAEDAYRIDYEHTNESPEFDTHHVADFGIRTEDDEVVAVRVSSVTEMVEDGSFDALVDTIGVVPN
ncbi:hypothetical protein [Halostreptopolyspora alba]|uniref:Uncharacterized protein n=1 Tax=Halostreptopolyspora alba TaxID=2487137 RepID=A0A3N0E6Q3_9ACTN|nr:hypothetical protein EFW17_16015 [Nocardiopsaceae bacterium YIM 96095]